MGVNSSISNTYKGKKVFITGHTGFKGSWLFLWLAEAGAQVKGYALAPEKESLYSIIEKSLKGQSVIADIRDQSKLEKEITDFQPDFIFHLAAQPLVRYSYEQPSETFEVNAMGTANLLQAVRKLKNKCSVVIVTTDKVYENKEQNYAYSENDKLGGYDPYSASKACAEIIAQSYRLSFFNSENIGEHKKSIATARAGNVIGGGDYAKDRIMPDIYRALSRSEVIRVRNPKSVRPWQHVLDPLSGYLLLGAKMHQDPAKYSQAYNFAPDAQDTLTVEELVQQAITGWGSGEYKAEPDVANLHEAGLLMLNNSKARSGLGWKPVYSSKEAIAHTIEWYKRSTAKGVNVVELCLQDIRTYESRILTEA